MTTHGRYGILVRPAAPAVRQHSDRTVVIQSHPDRERFIAYLTPAQARSFASAVSEVADAMEEATR